MVLVLVVFRLHPAIAFLVGALGGLVNWALWRPGGLGRRHEGEVGDEPVKWKEAVKFVLVTMVLTGLVVVVYALVE